MESTTKKVYQHIQLKINMLEFQNYNWQWIELTTNFFHTTLVPAFIWENASFTGLIVDWIFFARQSDVVERFIVIRPKSIEIAITVETIINEWFQMAIYITNPSMWHGDVFFMSKRKTTKYMIGFWLCFVSINKKKSRKLQSEARSEAL